MEVLLNQTTFVNRDPEYLAKLRDYYANHRALPPYSGIAKLVGMESKGSAATMVKRLANAGYLAISPDRRVLPGKKFLEREVLDSVRAGMPDGANNVLAESISIDEYLIDRPSNTVLLTVKGNSMADAGLMPGDTVVVKKGVLASPGDIVVANVDGEYTVKYLALKNGKLYLRPGNKAYPDIRPRDYLEIFGLVVGSFRKY